MSNMNTNNNAPAWVNCEMRREGENGCCAQEGCFWPATGCFLAAGQQAIDNVRIADDFNAGQAAARAAEPGETL